MIMLLLIVSRINLVLLFRNWLDVDVSFVFVNICTFRNQDTISVYFCISWCMVFAFLYVSKRGRRILWEKVYVACKIHALKVANIGIILSEIVRSC